MKVLPLRLRPADDLRLTLDAWMAEQSEGAGCVISGTATVLAPMRRHSAGSVRASPGGKEGSS